MKEYLFKLLFRQDYEHMVHLVDDVIGLEQERGILNKELSQTKRKLTKDMLGRGGLIPLNQVDANCSTHYINFE